ncbi:Hsp70 chaperone [Basidiobolus ranarum]|uniref:Hsp70 chaperone n=1 Tax=Basidiobolus ranarum TaxID=34480 RepID=A0ABR2WFD2_9FUNG
MVSEAEKYKAEDDEAASRISVKNGLEFYAHSLRNTLQDGKVAGQLDVNDKKKLKETINSTISWLNASQEASKEEYE